MKRFLAFIIPMILILPYVNLLAQEDWVKMDSPTNHYIWKLVCLDSLNCWAAGDSGLIIHTSNGGTNWQIQNSQSTELIQDIFFLNHNMGWAVTTRFDSIYGSYILKTTNGGTVWEKEFFRIENIFFHTIYFLDSLNGWVAGGPTYAFYRTTDAGITWNTPQFDSSLFSGLPVQSMTFYSPQYGFACGGLHDLIGVIWKTTDSGSSWSSKYLGPEPLRELYFIDSLNIIGVGGDFEYGTGVARTTNGGERWIYEEPGFLGVATGVSFRRPSEAWACLSSEAKFILSLDSGRTWNVYGLPQSSAIFDVVFTDSLHGYAVGDGGTILKYKPQITSVINDEVNIPSTNYLFQNYPNPFNPSTRISWQSTVSSWQTLKVYDVLGNEIVTLVDEYKPEGKYEVEYYSSEKLSSGIYFYQLKIGESLQAKKMLLLR